MARTYFPHIYFEAKRPRTRDSVYGAVKDIGKPGVRTSKEVGALAIAQLLDFLDGYTKDHRGRRIRFTPKLFAARAGIIRFLANRYGGKRHYQFMMKVYKGLRAGKITKKEARKLALQYAKKHKLPLTKIKIP